MKLQRDVNGIDLVSHLIRKWDFRKINQVGSHIMIYTDTPTPYTATIPAHKPMKTGTFAGIASQIASHKQVTRDKLLNGF